MLAPRAGAAPAVAQDVPKAQGWVTDLADLISSADEETLKSELEAWKRGSGHEIAVLTVNSLQGRTIEEFSLEVARTWGLGQKDISDAALLVVAKNDRKMRIEVLRGLEGTLTDLVCGRIIRDVLTPAFKRGEFSSGIVEGVRAMRAAAGGDLSSLPPDLPDMNNLIPNIFISFIVLVLVLRLLRAFGAFGKVLPATGRGHRGGWFIGTLGSLSSGRSSSGRSSGGFSGFGGGGGASGGGSSGGW